MKRQVSPIATGVMNTGITIKVRSSPTTRALVSSSRASRKPSTSCTETVTRHQTVVSRIVFQKTSSPVSR